MAALALEPQRAGDQITGGSAMGMFPPGIVPDKFHDGDQGWQIRGDQIVVPVDGIRLSGVVHRVYPGNLYVAKVPRRSITRAITPPTTRPSTIEAAMTLNSYSYWERCNRGNSNFPT